jgi:hypothetical protein
MKPKERKFVATPEKGEVSALLIEAPDASHVLVLGHGSSTNMRHANLQSIAERMSEVGIATFRSSSAARAMIWRTWISSSRFVRR